MRKPTFTKQVRKEEPKDTGFISRGQMAAKKEEEKKETPKPAESGAGPWRTSGAQSKPLGGEGGFRKGGAAPEKKNEKGDDGWSFSGGKREQNKGGAGGFGRK